VLSRRRPEHSQHVMPPIRLLRADVAFEVQLFPIKCRANTAEYVTLSSSRHRSHLERRTVWLAAAAGWSTVVASQPRVALAQSSTTSTQASRPPLSI
jgi:hypothetical protein